MKLSRMFLVAIMGCVLGSSVRADDATPPNPAAARRAEAVASLGKAEQLASFGRGEFNDASGLKNFSSPEALVAAGGILLRAAAVLDTEFETINDKGEPDKNPTTKPLSLKQKAQDLFDEATAMAGNDKAKQASLKALIEKAKTVPPVEETRGAVNKPRNLSRVLNPGQSVSITIQFQAGAPATISYDTVGGVRQRCEIIGPNGNTIYDNTGRSGSHSWNTVGDKNNRAITIRLTNNGGKPHTVTVTTN